MIAPPQALYGVVGYPLTHTMSPMLHSWGFSRTAYPGAYMAWAKTQQELPVFIQTVRTLPIAGISLTIPHKEHILPLLDALAPAARRIEAANTLFWQDGKLWGDNTDSEGFITPLLARPPCSLALVLGAGGAARAVVDALRCIGIPRILVAARDPAKRALFRKKFACEEIPWEERERPLRHPEQFGGVPGALWVVNTTPLGMSGARRNETPIPAAAFHLSNASGSNLAYDLVYNPLQTVFLRDAALAGWETQDGLDMLVAQGLAQFRIWTGHKLPHAEARAYLANLQAGGP